MPDLPYISTEDLWHEIAGRVDSAVLVVLRDEGGATNTELRHVYYKGRTTSIGLCAFAAHKLLGGMMEVTDGP